MAGKRVGWTVLVSSWADDPDDVWRASEPLADWAQEIVWMELGPWHRTLELPGQIRLGPEWQGSFAQQYDRAFRDRSGEAVLLLEGSETVRRMDLPQLQELAERGHEEAFTLPVMSHRQELVRPEIRMVKHPPIMGFRGAFKANPGPELLAFCEPVGQGTVEISRASGGLEPSGALQLALAPGLAPLVVRARAAKESRQYGQALELARRALARKSGCSAEERDQALLVQAQALAGQGRVKEAWAASVRLVARAPSADAVYTAAQALAALGRFEEAASYFVQLGSGAYGRREFQEPGADSFRALLAASRALQEAGRDKDGFEILSRLLAAYPYFREAWQQMMALFPEALPEDLYAVVTHIVPPSAVRAFFGRIAQPTESERIFQKWLGL